MENLLSFWNGLTVQRRIVVAVTTVALLMLVLLMARVANTPSMSLLYSGLDANTSGEVIAELQAQGALYEVRGTSIFVQEAARDQLRMTLASQGLPRIGSEGYEILEQMTGFGTTSQMFNAAYWRAKEGELARTIAGGANVASARVHIANVSGTPFQQKTKATASVTMMPKQGSIPPAQARAAQFLVASAVAGLTPSEVTVIDGNSGQIVSASSDDMAGTDQETRAKILQERVERLMSARVGPNRYVVEVTVETDRAEEVLVQRTLDPNSRIVISTDSEETTTESTNSAAGGAVTVASNLPEGDAGNGGNSASAQNASTRERVNYDVSATEREIKKAAGTIKKISVAVLVDGTTTTSENGETTWEPRSGEELETLRSLVASAVGFDAERGDTLTLQSLQFDQSFQEVAGGTLGAAPSLLEQVDIQKLIQFSILGIVVLALGLFVVRPAFKSSANGTAASLALSGPDTPAQIAKSPAARATSPAQIAKANGQPGLPDLPDLPALSGTVEERDAPFAMPAMGTVSDFDLGDMGNGHNDLPDLPAFSMGSSGDDPEEDPVERLRQLIEDRREETVEILRGWMEEKA